MCVRFHFNPMCGYYCISKIIYVRVYVYNINMCFFLASLPWFLRICMGCPSPEGQFRVSELQHPSKGVSVGQKQPVSWQCRLELGRTRVSKLPRKGHQLQRNLRGFPKIPRLQAEGFAPWQLQDEFIQYGGISEKSCLNLPALTLKSWPETFLLTVWSVGWQPLHLLGAG